MGLFDKGFVQVPRSMEDFPWADDPHTVAVYVHLCWAMRYTPGNYHGVPLESGQAATSLPDIMRRAGVTERQARTAMSRLKASGYVTWQTSGFVRVVTIVNQSVIVPAENGASGQTSGDSSGKRQHTKKERKIKKGREESAEALVVPAVLPDSGGDVPLPTNGSDGRINELVAYLISAMGERPTKQAAQRRGCWNLLHRMEADYPGQDPVKKIKLLIDAAMGSDFHKKTITGFPYLYSNLLSIRKEWREKNAKKDRFTETIQDAE